MGVPSTALVWEGSVGPFILPVFSPWGCSFSIMTPWFLQMFRPNISKSSSICSSAVPTPLPPPSPSPPSDPEVVWSCCFLPEGEQEGTCLTGSYGEARQCANVDRIQNESWGRAVVGDEQVEEDHVIPWRSCLGIWILSFTQREVTGKQPQPPPPQQENAGLEIGIVCAWKEGKGVSGAHKRGIDRKTRNIGSSGKKVKLLVEGMGHTGRESSDARE